MQLDVPALGDAAPELYDQRELWLTKLTRILPPWTFFPMWSVKSPMLTPAREVAGQGWARSQGPRIPRPAVQYLDPAPKFEP
jgi:hypothetical protein